MSKKTPTKPKRVYGGLSQTERVTKRKEALLLASTKLFGTVGYHSTTVKMICVEAGLTERYFYESFKNAEDCLAETYKTGLNRLSQNLVNTIISTPKIWDVFLPTLVKHSISLLKEDPHLTRILFIEILGVSPAVDELYRKSWIQMQHIILLGFASYLTEEVKEKYPVNLIITGIFGAIVHLCTQWLLEDFKKTEEEIAQSIIIICGAIGKDLLKLDEE